MDRRLPALLALLVLAPTAAASHSTGGSGSLSDWIDADIDVLLVNDLATLQLTVDVGVHKLEGTTAGQLRSAWQSGGAGANAPAVQAAVTALDTSFDASLAAMFPGATRTSTPAVPVAASFETGGTGAGDVSPPVRFTKTATITLAASDVGLSYTATQVEAVLATGARVLVEHTLRAEPGWRTTFELRLPAGWMWTDFASPAVLSAGGTVATVTLDAVDLPAGLTVGASPKLQSHVGSATATAATYADERVAAAIDVESPRAGVAGLPVRSTVVADIVALDTAARFPGALPARVVLPFLHADGLRALKTAGVLSDADLGAAVTSLKTDVKSGLDGAFGGAAAVDARFDNASLASGATGPVRLLAFANTSKDMGGASPAAVEAVLAGGATLRLNVTLDGTVGALTQYDLRLPAGSMRYTDVAGGTKVSDTVARVALDGRNLTTAPTAALALRVRHPAAPDFTAEDANVEVLVDLKELETSLSGLAGGDLGSILVAVEVAFAMGVVEIPDEVRASLPANVELRFLSADTIRALKAAGALNDSVLADLETAFLTEARKNLQGFAAGAPVAGGLDDASLTAPAAGAHDGTPPVRLVATSSFRMFLDGRPAEPVAATVLQEITQTFDLAGIDGRETVYKVVFPRGLALVGLAAPGAMAEIGTHDGRDAGIVTVPPGGSTAATATLGITPLLAWDLFPLLVIALGVVLVALVALPVWGVVRLVRKR